MYYQVIVQHEGYLTDYANKVIGTGTSFINYGNTSFDNGHLLLRGGTFINYGGVDLTSPVSTVKYSDATYYFDKTAG